ncbi:MAG: hypothetical protein OXF96_00975, partial [Chloroflexi bacterium]|nr:hypothetical protein [Chloroflexota bacterium]
MARAGKRTSVDLKKIRDGSSHNLPADSARVCVRTIFLKSQDIRKHDVARVPLRLAESLHDTLQTL